MDILILLGLITFPANASPPIRNLPRGDEVAIEELCEEHESTSPSADRLDPDDICTVETLVERGILRDEIIHYGADGISVLYPLEGDALVEAIEFYEERLRLLYGHDEPRAASPAEQVSDGDDDEPPELQHSGRALDRVDDGQNGFKQIFGTDGRTVQTNFASYPYTKFVIYGRGRPTRSELSNVDGCSGVFLDETHVLTAAHCVYDTWWNTYNCGHGWGDDCPNDHVGLIYTSMGVDNNYGYVCYRNGPEMTTPPSPDWAFDTECEFVIDVFVPSLFIGASDEGTSQGINNDYAILTLDTFNFPNGLGDGRWMALSSITDPQVMATKVAVIHSYPNATPNGLLNYKLGVTDWIVDDWEVGTGAQYKTSGTISSTSTQAKLKTNLDSGVGESARLFSTTPTTGLPTRAKVTTS